MSDHVDELRNHIKPMRTNQKIFFTCDNCSHKLIWPIKVRPRDPKKTLPGPDLLSKTAFLNHSSLFPETQTLLVIWGLSVFVDIKEKISSQKSFKNKQKKKQYNKSQRKVKRKCSCHLKWCYFFFFFLKKETKPDRLEIASNKWKDAPVHM